MTHLARIATRLFGVPLLVMPDVALTIANVLSERVAADLFSADDIAAAVEMSRFRGTPSGPQRPDGTRAAYYRTEGGVAVVPVMGELVNRGAWIGASSGLTSYEGFGEQIRAAAADTAIRGVVLDMNTPGGEAFGAFEAGSAVRAVAAEKPVVAFVNGMACSAGYAIACGASNIVCIPSGIVGSIGVIMMHMDRSAALQKAGLKPTLIHAGAHKADMSPLRELPEESRARLQGFVDETYGLFVSTVAESRKLDPEAVRATEGGVLMGAAAVKAGLADSTGTLDDCFAIIDRARPRAGYIHGAKMSDPVSRADHDAAVLAARNEGFGAGMAAGQSNVKAEADKARAEGATAERDRVKAILTAPEAKGREASALNLALKGGMEPEAAVDFLKTVPEASVAPPSRMGYVPRPPVQPDSAGAEAKAETDHGWGGIVQSGNAAAGFNSR